MKTPGWAIAVAIYVIYNAIIYGTWAAVGADYANMTGADVVFQRLDLPLILGAIFMAAAITWLGWWRPVMTEDRRGRPGWVLWLILLFMIGLMATLAVNTDWGTIGAVHLGMLILGGVLVGFNEESLNRGVLVVGLRGTTRSEPYVWFLSTLLFGLMHLPNGFFGIGFGPAAMQVVFAFLAGTGLYLIRRVSGALLPAMVVHGAWDFFTFAHGASDGAHPPVVLAFQFGTYIISIALVLVVLRTDRNEDETPLGRRSERNIIARNPPRGAAAD